MEDLRRKLADMTQKLQDEKTARVQAESRAQEEKTAREIAEQGRLLAEANLTKLRSELTALSGESDQLKKTIESLRIKIVQLETELRTARDQLAQGQQGVSFRITISTHK